MNSERNDSKKNNITETEAKCRSSSVQGARKSNQSDNESRKTVQLALRS